MSVQVYGIFNPGIRPILDEAKPKPAVKRIQNLKNAPTARTTTASDCIIIYFRDLE